MAKPVDEVLEKSVAVFAGLGSARRVAGSGGGGKIGGAYPQAEHILTPAERAQRKAAAKKAAAARRARAVGRIRQVSHNIKVGIRQKLAGKKRMERNAKRRGQVYTTSSPTLWNEKGRNEHGHITRRWNMPSTVDLHGDAAFPKLREAQGDAAEDRVRAVRQRAYDKAQASRNPYTGALTRDAKKRVKQARKENGVTKSVDEVLKARPEQMRRPEEQRRKKALTSRQIQQRRDAARKRQQQAQRNKANQKMAEGDKVGWIEQVGKRASVDQKPVDEILKNR